MNDLGLIACGSGLQYGLNPCMLMTCAVFVIQGLWFPLGSLRTVRLRIVFALVYALSFLIFNFGPAQILLFQKDFIIAAKILYFVLGTGAFVLGVLFFKDWVLLHRRLAVEKPADDKIKAPAANGVVVYVTIIIAAILLSALATLWPINNYLMLLGNEALLKGQWQIVMPLLGTYVFVSMWPLWLVWAFISIKNVRPSLVKIVYASIFFTASSSMIFIFK